MKTQRLAAMLAMTAASLCAGQSAVTQKATVTVCMESDSHGNEMRALKVGRAAVGMAGMMQAEAPKPESKIRVLVYNYAEACPPKRWHGRSVRRTGLAYTPAPRFDGWIVL